LMISVDNRKKIDLKPLPEERLFIFTL